MIFAAFNGRVTPSRCAIRYMAGWEVTMSDLPRMETRGYRLHAMFLSYSCPQWDIPSPPILVHTNCFRSHCLG